MDHDQSTSRNHAKLAEIMGGSTMHLCNKTTTQCNIIQLNWFQFVCLFFEFVLYLQRIGKWKWWEWRWFLIGRENMKDHCWSINLCYESFRSGIKVGQKSWHYDGLSKQNIYNSIIVIMDSTSPNNIHLDPKRTGSELQTAHLLNSRRVDA